MADPLSATASIIALLQGINGCWKIYSSVKDAAKDIDGLQREVASVDVLIKRVDKLARGPFHQKLTESEELKVALSGCEHELETLKDKLGAGKQSKLLGIIKKHAKWPFTSADTFKIVNNLERWKGSIGVALNIIQVDQLAVIDRKLDLAGLPLAEGATYGSAADQHEPECLQGTRTELLENIARWADDPSGKCIFWVSGVAGTGKSTITRTVARSLKDKRQLAGSFFFRRGEKDRGDGSKFFTTLAYQLATHFREIVPSIQQALEADPLLATMAFREQFEKLIQKPFAQLGANQCAPKRAFVIVDALDECDGDDNQKLVISLLARLKDIKTVDLRVFLTSRPELPLRLGFEELSGGTYQDMILHEAPGIEHDIETFLNHEFLMIRKNHSMPPDWPGSDNIGILVRMAVPLFIFAATACRFIGDRHHDPEEQIKILLEYQTNRHVWNMEKTYLPVLHHFIVEEPAVQDELAGDFRTIVGAILILVTPLSTPSLSRLLSIKERKIKRRLDLLHSVLELPTEFNPLAPVRTLHLSFRDFLSDQRLRNNTKFGKFWIDEKESHRAAASRCIGVMLGPEGLKKDICGLQSPGTLKSEINDGLIEAHISPELQYACRYWIHHLEQSGTSIRDHGEEHVFLQKHLLHWLEVIGILGYSDKLILMTSTLQPLLEKGASNELSNLILDMKRFVQQNSYLIGIAPLQTYASAIVFSPTNSAIRKLFDPRITTPWVTRLPHVQHDWDAHLQTLEGHTNSVTAVAFSPDGKTLASASKDKTIRLWDAASGVPMQTLEGHTSSVTAVVFSPNGKTLASASDDNTVRLWDAASGAPMQMLEGHRDRATAVAFSPDGKTLASASDDKTVRLWDAASGVPMQTLEGHTNSVTAVAFSPDGKTLASASKDKTVRLWDAASGALMRTLEGHTDWATAVAFSPDSKTLASASEDSTVRLWDAASGVPMQTLEGHTSSVRAVVFSPDGKTLASASDDKTVRLWDAALGVPMQTLEGHRDRAVAVAFSPDSKTLASASDDKTVKLWDAASGAPMQMLKGQTSSVRAIVFSPNGKTLASLSNSKTFRLWNVASGVPMRTLEGHTNWVKAVAFSPDGKTLASASNDKTIRLWDAASGALMRTLEGHTNWVITVAFSPDGKTLASTSNDKTVGVWDAASGALMRTLEGHKNWATAVAFSPDGKTLASASNDSTVRLWDAASGALMQTLEGHTNWATAVAFSPDGKTLASASNDSTVRLWDAASGAPLQSFQSSLFRVALSFSDHGQCLYHGHQRFLLSSNISPDLGPTVRPRVHVEDEWVCKDGERCLWLPHNRRTYFSAVYGILVALGHESDHVSIIGL